MGSDILALIAFLSSTAGAGVAASALMDWLRRTFPRPTAEAWKGFSWWKRGVYQAMWAPKWTRYTVFAFSLLISLLFTGIGGWFLGEPVAPLLAACLSMWASQVRHAMDLSGMLRLEEQKPS